MNNDKIMKKKRKDKERRKKVANQFSNKDNFVKIEPDKPNTEAVLTSLIQCNKCQKFYEFILTNGEQNVVLKNDKLSLGKIISVCTHCKTLQEKYPLSVKIKIVGSDKELIYNLRVNEDV